MTITEKELEIIALKASLKILKSLLAETIAIIDSANDFQKQIEMQEVYEWEAANGKELASKISGLHEKWQVNNDSN